MSVLQLSSPLTATSTVTSPVRSSLLHFFSALHAFDSPSALTNHTANDAVKHAAHNFRSVADVHFDTYATSSDAFYARFVTSLKVITPTQLGKLCAGFRLIQVSDGYTSLNRTCVQTGEGLRALFYGCEHGIIPTALSYRHNPHTLSLPDAPVITATVGKHTAERFQTLVNSSDASIEDIAVVWIDRAVKGLSTDGEWFVRGLLPYCIALICPAYSDDSAFRRPWIWLEWKLSLRTHSSSQIVAVVDYRDILLIALQALYLPADILGDYEFASEMESVIQDMLCFGLSAAALNPMDGTARRDVLKQWSDYKVGYVMTLACTANEMGQSTFVKGGTFSVDGRDAYGCGLFADGICHMLNSYGMTIRKGSVRTSPGSSILTMYKMVDEQFAFVKRLLQDGREMMVVATRVPSSILTKVSTTTRGVNVGIAVEHEYFAIMERYDLILKDALIPALNNLDALAVLACCDAEIQPPGPEKHTKSKDDLYIDYFPHVRQKKSSPQHPSKNQEAPQFSRRIASAYSKAHLRLQFNGRKAETNCRRKHTFSLQAWINRLCEQSGDSNCQETQMMHENGRIAQGDFCSSSLVWLWFDFRGGVLRWVEGSSNEAAVPEGEVTFRRLDLSHLSRGCMGAGGSNMSDFCEVIVSRKNRTSKNVTEVIRRLLYSQPAL